MKPVMFHTAVPVVPPRYACQFITPIYYTYIYELYIITLLKNLLGFQKKRK